MATETEIQASEARRRELGKLNLLVRKLQTECVTVGNDVIGDLIRFCKLLSFNTGAPKAHPCRWSCSTHKEPTTARSAGGGQLSGARRGL